MTSEVKIEAKTFQTKAPRLKLPVQGRPHWLSLTIGISLGYRRTEGVGTWSVRIADGKGGASIKKIAAADDHARADGKNIMDFTQAQAAALRYATSGGRSAAPVAAALTLGEALDAYAADLEARNGDRRNASRLRRNLPPPMLKCLLATITPKELTLWRNAVAERQKPSSVNRLLIVFRAVMHLAQKHGAKLDPQWRDGLETLPNAREAHNDVRPQETIARLVHAARARGPEVGLMVEVMAQTGARYSQLCRCNVRDLQADALCLMVPASYKGKKTKKMVPARVPLPEDLIARLRLAAADRPGAEPLLRKPSGTRWGVSELDWHFEKCVKAIGEEGLTGYTLRQY